jgi:hypothetical protein
MSKHRGASPPMLYKRRFTGVRKMMGEGGDVAPWGMGLRKRKGQELSAGEKPLAPGDTDRLAAISRRQMASLRRGKG